MKAITKIRLIFFTMIISLGIFALGCVFLHQSVTALMQSSTLVFFGIEVSASFIFDLSITFLIIAWIILAGIIIGPELSRIKLGGK